MAMIKNGPIFINIFQSNFPIEEINFFPVESMYQKNYSFFPVLKMIFIKYCLFSISFKPEKDISYIGIKIKLKLFLIIYTKFKGIFY